MGFPLHYIFLWIALQTMIVGNLFALGVSKLFFSFLNPSSISDSIAVLVKKGWLGLMALLTLDLMGVKMVIYRTGLTGPGNEQKSDSLNWWRENIKKNTLFFSNHECRLDWFFLWPFFLYTGRLGSLKIIMKDMRKVPFLGWACDHFKFIFLSRKDKDTDLKSINDNIVEGSESKSSDIPPTSLLIFPEGTDRSDSNLEKSIVFQKENLKRGEKDIWKNVLVPKAAGFQQCVKSLEEREKAATAPKNSSSNGSNIDIFDLTIAYEGNTERPSEEGCFIRGSGFPKKVKILIESGPTTITSEEKAKEYLESSFKLKNVLLNAGNKVDSKSRKEKPREEHIYFEEFSTENKKIVNQKDCKEEEIVFSRKERIHIYGGYLLFELCVILCFILQPLYMGLVTVFSALSLAVGRKNKMADQVLLVVLISLIIGLKKMDID